MFKKKMFVKILKVQKNKTLLLFFILSLLFNCSKKKTETVIIDSLRPDSNLSTQLETKFNQSRNDSLIAAEDEYLRKIKEVFKDTMGTIEGTFEGAELGDDGHLSIKDSSGLVLSFYIDENINISEKLWNEMVDGRLNGKKVKIEWIKQKKYIEPIQEYQLVETATKIQFE